MSTAIATGTRLKSWPTGGMKIAAAAMTRTTATTSTATSSTARSSSCQRDPVSGRGSAMSDPIRADRNADRGDQDPAGEGGTALRQEPGLGAVEGHGQVGTDDGVRRVAGGEIDGRRRVDCNDRDAELARPADRLDGGPDRVAEGAANAGAEEGIDDDGRPFDALGEDRGLSRDGGMDAGDAAVPFEPVPVACRIRSGGPPLGRDERDDDRGAGQCQAACRDGPVATVVAWADQDEDRAA